MGSSGQHSGNAAKSRRPRARVICASARPLTGVTPVPAHDPIRLYKAASVQQPVSKRSGRLARLIGNGTSVIPGMGAGGQRDGNAPVSHHPGGRVICASVTSGDGHHTRVDNTRPTAVGQAVSGSTAGVGIFYSSKERRRIFPQECRDFLHPPPGIADSL